MKVLFVTTQYGYAYRQGTERYIGDLSTCLRRRGHDVGCLAGDPLQLGPRLRLGLPVPGHESLFACPTRGEMAVVGLEPERIVPWLVRHAPDVVHVNNPAHIGIGVMVACRMVGIPTVVTVHDFWWLCPKATLLRPAMTVCDGTPGWQECIRCTAAHHHRRLVRQLARLPLVLSPLTMMYYFSRAAKRGFTTADALRWTRRRVLLLRQLAAADEIIFPSAVAADSLAHRLGHRRWRVIPHGLPDSWFAGPRLPPVRPKPPEQLTLGFAGVLGAYKAPHLLLQAVRRLGWLRARVRIAGPIGDRAYAQALRREAAGLNVEFPGPLEHAQMPAFLRSLDILAVTSLCPENFPYIVLEAQAANVAVVAGRIGGLAEQIGDRQMLFRPGDVEGLAATLAYAREHIHERATDGVRTAEEMTSDTEAAYLAAINRHPA